MDTHSTRVTVKRIEKIPSKYYVQVPKTQVHAQTNIKVELSDSICAEARRLSGLLSFVPPQITDYSKGFAAFFKKQAARIKTAAKGLWSASVCLLAENAKRLAFSTGVSAGIALLSAVILLSTCSLGYEIKVGGQVIGTAKNARVYNTLVEEINHEIGYVVPSGFETEDEPTFSLRLIAKNAYSSKEEMKEQLKATSGEMIPAYGVLADDEILFAMANEQAARAVLTDYKNSFIEGMQNATADFCQKVTISRRYVPKDALKTENGAMLALEKGRIALYQANEGEALSDIAAGYGITVDDILQNNYIGDVTNISAGVLKIPTGTPLLAVKTVEHKTIEEAVPYNTVETENNSLYRGRTVVKQEGADGVRVIEANITSINGVETEREILSENLISSAVDRIIQKGTKEPPSPIGTGSLSVPTSGSLSSRFGSRWGRNHNGIDFAASTGTNIYAADNGTVTYSAYNNGGYGYMIQIDHGNGIETYYAHCSELLVPEGAVVAKGDLIAKVGNTGRSTGAHLHFEVRKNGTPMNPSSYLN